MRHHIEVVKEGTGGGLTVLKRVTSVSDQRVRKVSHGQQNQEAFLSGAWFGTRIDLM